VHREALDLRKGLSHFEAQVSHFSTGTAALFGRRLQRMDELVALSRALSAQEIQDQYEAGTPYR